MGQKLTRGILSRYGKQWRREVGDQVAQLDALEKKARAGYEEGDLDRMEDAIVTMELLTLAWQKPVGRA